jgi:DNA-binding GntR family transcriptional regulator
LRTNVSTESGANPRPAPSADIAQRIDLVREPPADAEKSTLATAVYDRIKHEIFGFRLPPGQRFSEQVKPFDLANYEDLYDFRVQIEIIAVRRICVTVPVSELRVLGAFWCVPKRQRNLDGQTFAREDEQFHAALVALAGKAQTAENLIKTHIAHSRAEIRRITLHHFSIATEQAARA